MDNDFSNEMGFQTIWACFDTPAIELLFCLFVCLFKLVQKEKHLNKLTPDDHEDKETEKGQWEQSRCSLPDFCIPPFL